MGVGGLNFGSSIPVIWLALFLGRLELKWVTRYGSEVDLLNLIQDQRRRLAPVLARGPRLVSFASHFPQYVTWSLDLNMRRKDRPATKSQDRASIDQTEKLSELLWNNRPYLYYSGENFNICTCYGFRYRRCSREDHRFLIGRLCIKIYFWIRKVSIQLLPERPIVTKVVW